MAQRKATAREAQRAEERWAQHRNVMRETAEKRFADLSKLYDEKQCAAVWKYHAAMWLRATMPCVQAEENIAEARAEMKKHAWDKERLLAVLTRMWQLEAQKRRLQPNGTVFDEEVGRLLSEAAQIESR